MVNDKNKQSIEIAYAWCLAWGNDLAPQVDLNTLVQMRQAMHSGEAVPAVVQPYVEQAQTLENLTYPETLEALKATANQYPELWNSKVGLVYGGATKIKQYVFEASKLQDIRGASALLDRINLIDLPAFFNQHPDSHRFDEQFAKAQNWLSANTPRGAEVSITDALIPELIVYSTGGNILAFCPAAYVHQLANAIEKRYTQETLTANSCAVGDTFRFLELQFGLLKDPIEQTNWLEWYRDRASEDLVKAYFGNPETDLAAQFARRKSFNELVGKLATRFNQRRSGHDWPEAERPSRRYPPMFETHPYVRRDDTERRSAARQIKDSENQKGLPGQPWFSDTLARKRIAGQKAKRDRQNTAWYKPEEWLNWEPGEFESWVNKFEGSLKQNSRYRSHPHYRDLEAAPAHKEARSLREIGNASHPKGVVAYIYADGNNMGGYIQKIGSAEEYKSFSDRVSQATEICVYRALEAHLNPHQLSGIDDAETQGRDGKWIHPFEILTIGGDDVMLVVPANRALAIAKTLAEQFEILLLEQQDPKLRLSAEEARRPQDIAHRYRPSNTQLPIAECKLSMSVGVLITAQDTPIYYAQNLTQQLLKSAKKYSKQLQPKPGQEDPDYFYPGGTIDFLVMKSVTMLSSKVREFRESGLVFDDKPKRKLYGAPYTLHEIGGLIETVQALKQAEFPRSQLYQIRSLLEQGKNTAILNYRYFRVRLKDGKQKPLLDIFETGWCQPQDPNNKGNLAPWMSLKTDSDTIYETIWRELVDLYPFIDDKEQTEPEQTSAMSTHANGRDQ